MSGDDDRTATVLVVDDDLELLDLYERFLGSEYRVATAASGDAAIDRLDDDLDVVLLDRRMPETSGEEVLAAIHERGLDCRVAMVTAVPPDFDIVELGIDEYIVKPVTRLEVCRTVERLLLFEEFTERRRELNARRIKRNVLSIEKTGEELRESEEYRRLSREIERLERTVAELTESLDGTPLVRYS